MGSGYKAPVEGVDAFIDMVRGLQRQVDSLRGANRMQGASLFDGTLTVGGNGVISVVDANGEPIGRIDADGLAQARPDGTWASLGGFAVDVENALAAINDVQLEVDAAKESIREAGDAAAEAQLSADGKSTVWYAQPPADATHRVGDTWFDGGAIKRWDGSTWVNTLLGAAALANGAVDTTKLAEDVATSIQNASARADQAVADASAAQTAADTALSDAEAAAQAALDAALAASTAQETADSKATPAQVDAARQAAIDAAATDAQAKATAAAQAAEQAAKDYADAQASGASGDALEAAKTYAEQQAAAAQAAAEAAAAADATAKANAARTAAEAKAQEGIDAAATADGKAVAAQNTANAKGKVIIQAAAPAAADQLAQNLWIDTTGGANTPKRWSGSAWVAVTDKAATDAASAAVTAQNAATAAQGRADAAHDLATSAGVAANNAQTTANGKNTVSYGTTSSPSTTGRVNGDLHFVRSGNTITGQQRLVNNAWVTETLTNSVIATLDAGKITTGTLAAGRLAAGTITAANGILADLAVTQAKIALLAVGTAQIADLAVSTAKIADLAVGTAKIADLAVSNAKIANLDAGKITTGFLAAARLEAGTIVADLLATDAVTATKIAAGAMTAKIIAGDVIATALTGQRVQISTSGIITYDSANAVTATLSAAAGAMNLTGVLNVAETGEVRVGNAANFVRLATSTVTSDIGVTSSRGSILFGGSQYVRPAEIYADASDISYSSMQLNSPSAASGAVRTYWRMITAEAGRSNELETNASWLRFRGSTTLTAESALWLAPGGNNRLTPGGDVQLEPDGYVTSTRIYNFTASATANLAINATTQRIHRISSSLIYKDDVRDLDIPRDLALRLRPRTWLDKGEVERYAADPENEPMPIRYPGFVAEEVLAAGGGIFVQFADGRPDALYYDRILGAVVIALQDMAVEAAALRGRTQSLEAIVEQLTTRNTELEADVEQLEATVIDLGTKFSALDERVAAIEGAAA